MVEKFLYFILGILLIYLYDSLLFFITDRWSAKKSNYDCSKCKNWACSKYFCEKYSKGNVKEESR